jgi:hypothetical protein
MTNYYKLDGFKTVPCGATDGWRKNLVARWASPGGIVVSTAVMPESGTIRTKVYRKGDYEGQALKPIDKTRCLITALGNHENAVYWVKKHVLYGHTSDDKNES